MKDTQIMEVEIIALIQYTLTQEVLLQQHFQNIKPKWLNHQKANYISTKLILAILDKYPINGLKPNE